MLPNRRSSRRAELKESIGRHASRRNIWVGSISVWKPLTKPYEHDLKVVRDVAGDDELRLLCAKVVGGQIVGVLQPKLWTEKHGGANPAPITNQVFGVLRCEAGSLTLDVVDKLISDRKITFRAELFFDIVDDGSLWSEARLLSIRAE